MIPVDQTTFGEGKGNCFTACVASCLELPIEDVPNFCVDYSDEEWWEELEKWCAKRGLAPMTFCFDRGEQTNDKERLSAWYVDKRVPIIVSGLNQNGVAHSIVVCGDVTHDPNPNRLGLKSYRDLIVFVALRPGEVRPT